MNNNLVKVNGVEMNLATFADGLKGSEVVYIPAVGRFGVEVNNTLVYFSTYGGLSTLTDYYTARVKGVEIPTLEEKLTPEDVFVEDVTAYAVKSVENGELRIVDIRTGAIETRQINNGKFVSKVYQVNQPEVQAPTTPVVDTNYTVQTAEDVLRLLTANGYSVPKAYLDTFGITVEQAAPTHTPTREEKVFAMVSLIATELKTLFAELN